MDNILRAGVVFIAVFLLNGCARDEEAPPRPQSPEGAVAGDFTIAPCVHLARDVEYEAECGTLIVPENRQGENSRLIVLPEAYTRFGQHPG